MKNKQKVWKRPTGKRTDIFVIAFLLSLVIMYGGDGISELLFWLIPFDRVCALITTSESVTQFLLDYFWFIGIWILFFLVCVIWKRNRPMLRQLAPNRNGNNLKGALIGLLLGFGTNGFCILMSVILGDIHLSFYEFSPALFFSFLFVVLIQSGGEEITDRVFLYQKLRRRYRNPAVAIVGNSVVFGAIHLFNPGVSVFAIIDIIVSGLIFSLIVYYYDSVWAAITYHAAWNFTQNIIFGLPNSGLVSEYSVFKLEAASAGNGLFYNVDFGVEGSIGAILIEGILLVVIIMVNRRKPEKNDVWGKAAAEAGL